MTPVCLRTFPLLPPSDESPSDGRLVGLSFSPDVPLGKFPSTQNILFWLRHHHRMPWTYALSRPDPATVRVPYSWSTPMLARTHVGHDNLAYDYSPQSQSGVGLRIIHQWNSLRIPFSWLLGEGSFGDGGRRASLGHTPLRLWRPTFCR